MAHNVLIVIHAVAAVAALGTGLLSLRSARTTQLLAAHAALTTVMAAVLPLSLAVGWSELTTLTRGIFVALSALAAVMAGRSWLARRAAQRGHDLAVVEHVGFTLIALVTGFLTVAVLRAGGGSVGVVAAAIAVPLLGHLVMSRLRTRVAG
ncbi:hypothetical protein [Ruania zhangjianzhongii]|uniref:hypothetical protein n=1 Tax=Ruania zhangjianzhongii TaxID=2603206 RepID=UPI0011D1CFB2|nr:hypothetical protein [Ruania zhangjianzhongii]